MNIKRIEKKYPYPQLKDLKPGDVFDFLGDEKNEFQVMDYSLSSSLLDKHHYTDDDKKHYVWTFNLRQSYITYHDKNRHVRLINGVFEEKPHVE